MSDSQIRIAIAGAGGRMGRQLIRAVQQAEGVVLGAALSRPGSSFGRRRRRRTGGHRRAGRQGERQSGEGGERVRYFDRLHPPGKHPGLRIFAWRTTRRW